MVAPVAGNRSVAQVSASNGAEAATQLADQFYKAFAKGDNAAMAQMYSDDVKFHDPLFGHLNGKAETMNMWNTIQPSTNPATTDIRPQVVGQPTQNKDGSWDVKVHWDASYDIGKPGKWRHIDNHADTTLTIKDGKITHQRDDWDLQKWTAQAVPRWAGGGTKVGDVLTHLAAEGLIKLTTPRTPPPMTGWTPF